LDCVLSRAEVLLAKASSPANEPERNELRQLSSQMATAFHASNENIEPRARRKEAIYNRVYIHPSSLWGKRMRTSGDRENGAGATSHCVSY
jgi:hypothetical protein